MKEYKLFIQRIGLIGFTNILIALSNLILLIILTKNFSINEYGIWVQFYTTLVLLPNIATLGLPYTFVRYFSAETNKKKIQRGFYSIFSLVLISSFLISLFLCIFSQSIANLLFNGESNITMILSLVVFFASLNVFLLNFFRTFQKMKKYSIFLILQTYLGVFLISYFAIEGFGIFITALGLLISNFITFLIMVILIALEIDFIIPKFKNTRKYLSFGLPTIPTSLSYWIIESSDRYIIGIMLGTAFVGYYSPGYVLGNLILMIAAPFNLLLPSILPKYYEEGNVEKVKIFLKYSVKYFLLIAIPSVFVISILSKNLLILLTTPDIALNGYYITPFVALSALLFGLYGNIANIIILKKETKILGFSWIIAAIFNIIFNIMFIPYIGILAAAIMTLLAYLIALIITLFYSYKYFNFEFDLKFIFKCVFTSIIISMIIVFINPVGILNILIVIGISFLVYLILVLILGCIKKEEIILLKSLIMSNNYDKINKL